MCKRCKNGYKNSSEGGLCSNQVYDLGGKGRFDDSKLVLF